MSNEKKEMTYKEKIADRKLTLRALNVVINNLESDPDKSIQNTTMLRLAKLKKEDTERELKAVGELEASL